MCVRNIPRRAVGNPGGADLIERATRAALGPLRQVRAPVPGATAARLCPSSTADSGDN